MKKAPSVSGGALRRNRDTQPNAKRPPGRVITTWIVSIVVMGLRLNQTHPLR